MPVTVYLNHEHTESFEIEAFNFICPFCAREGLKSRLMTGGGSVTAMAYTSYYDEEGRLHNHDPNTRRNGFRCTNGHIFDHKHTGACRNCTWTGHINEITLHSAQGATRKDEPGSESK